MIMKTDKYGITSKPGFETELAVYASILSPVAAQLLDKVQMRLVTDETVKMTAKTLNSSMISLQLYAISTIYQTHESRIQ